MLCYSPNMDPRGKEKERLAKNNLAAHSRKGEVQNRVAVWREVHIAAQERNQWRAHVEALCANLAPGDK